MYSNVHVFDCQSILIFGNSLVRLSPVAECGDAGLIVQDPPCYIDRLYIPGYSEAGALWAAEGTRQKT